MKYVIIIAVLLIGLVFAIPFIVPPVLEKQYNKVEKHPSWDISIAAEQLHQTMIIGDWHSDSTLWARDLSKRSNYGHVDIPRLQEGNVAIQMFTVVTKSPKGQNYNKNTGDAGDNITLLAMVQAWPVATWDSLFNRAVYQAKKIHSLAEKMPEQLAIVLTAEDLQRTVEKRKDGSKQVAALIGTEGSHALDGDMHNVQRLFDAGFRMMSLQHFFDNRLGGSLHGLSGAGLTPFGYNVVKKINELNIVLDVSHSSAQVVEDVLSVSTRPVVVSHTGLKGNCDTPRNLTDNLMKKIASNGGLIGIGYWDAAVCDYSPKGIARSIKYGIELVGSDHISLGSDFDGSVTTTIDTSELVAITESLMQLGVPNEDIRKVMGGNMYRFLREQLPQS